MGPQSSTLKPGRSRTNSIVGKISPSTGEFYNWLEKKKNLASARITLRSVSVRLNSKSVPEGVREGLHSKLGWAVSSTNERQPPQDTGHVDHPAAALLQQRQELEGHVNHADQVHV